MKALKMSVYALLGVALGAFFVACAEVEFVDDYSDATFYDDEHSNEYAIVEDGDEYADEELIEEVVSVYDDEVAPSSADKGTAQTKIEDKSTTKDEAKNIAQKLDSTPKTAQKPDSEADEDDEITIIDDNTFEYQGMVFKHNLGKDADLSAILDSFEGKTAESIQSDEIVVESLEMAQSKVESTAPKSVESSTKSMESSTKSANLTQKPTQTQTAQPKTTKPTIAKSSVKKPSTGVIRGVGLGGINQSTAKLKSQCDSKGDLQKCEALARIYAIQGKRDLSVLYYDKACDSGEGSVRACFFLSRIYENDGNGAVASDYVALLGGREAKIANTELNLSTGKVDSAKRALKMSCTEGNEGSCKSLQSVFKVRGEKREMRTYFGTECWRGSALGCEILRSM